MIKKIQFFVCGLVVAVGMTSCQTIQNFANNEQVGNIVKTVLNTYVAQQGTTYNCTGTGSYALWTNKGTQASPNFSAGKTQTASMTIPVVASTTSAQITLPTTTIDGATMEGVVLGALTLSNSTLTVGDNTTAAGTLTVNGTAYSVSGAYLNNCTFTNGTLNAGTVQVYFGSNYEYLVNLSFQ